jgi:hypothetical protein
MNSYSVILRNGDSYKEITLRANGGDSAQAEALAKAAELSQQTGTQWRVSRCAPA